MASGYGGDRFYGSVVRRWAKAGVGTNAGVTVTQTALAADKIASAASVQCSGDAAALVTVESPAGTVIYKKRYAAAFNMSETFPPGTIKALSATGTDVPGQDILVKISASTANCEANIQGFDSLPGA